MKVTNGTKQTPLGLPSGVVIEPGQSREIANWDTVKKHRVVAIWLRSGKLIAGASKEAKSAQPSEHDEDAQKDALIEQLAEFGIEKTRRTSLESLQKQLEEAKAAQ